MISSLQLWSAMSSFDKSITSAARKRSRSPSSIHGPDCTKISRQSTSPLDGNPNTIQETSSPHHERAPGVGEDQGPTLPSAKSSKQCLIYIVSKKIPSAQLSHLKGIAKKNKFPLSTTLWWDILCNYYLHGRHILDPCALSDDVTHVVSALPSFERTQTIIEEWVLRMSGVVTYKLTNVYMELFLFSKIPPTAEVVTLECKYTFYTS